MTMHVRDAGTWKTVTAPSVRDAGTWKTVTGGWVRDAGTWKQFFSGLTVSPDTSNVVRSSDATTVYAGLAFNSDGTETMNSVAGGADMTTLTRGNWLDAGSASAVWVERVITSGTLDYLDPGAGRLQLSTSRFYAVSDSNVAGGSVDCVVTFNFYDAASGGSLIGTSGAITLSANREVAA